MASVRPAAAALRTIREFLDETSYPLVDFLVAGELDARLPLSGFPPFAPLQEAVRRLDPVQRTLFRLFRLGEGADDPSVRAAIPGHALDAMTDAGLLARDAEGAWRTPGLLVVPFEGLLLVVAVPSSYPTAGASAHPVFDLTTHVLARALPGSLAGLRVLDVCSGCGVQGLLCAMRGAASVVGLELSEEAVEVARVNAVLNGVEDRVEFRVSDLLESVREGEVFDFVVCNTPYVPMLADAAPPSGVEAIGSGLLPRVVPGLPRLVSPAGRGILASWRTAGYRSSTYRLASVAEALEAAGFSVSAVVDRTEETAESVLRMLQGDLDRRPGARPARTAEIVRSASKLLRGGEPPVDGFYNQIISFRRDGAGTAGRARPSYGFTAG